MVGVEPYEAVSTIGPPSDPIVLFACLICGALVSERRTHRNPRQHKDRHNLFHAQPLVTPWNPDTGRRGD